MKNHHWQRNFRILWSGRLLATASLTGISPFIPLYMQQLGVNETADILWWSGLALGAPAVSYAITTPLWGMVNDRWSRKWMVVRALVGLGLSIAAMGFAQTPLQFLIWRICQGAFGGISDTSTAYVGAEAPSERQGEILGRLQYAVSAGLLIGPLLGGFGSAWLDFRGLLYVMGGLTLGCALVAAWGLNESVTGNKDNDTEVPRLWRVARKFMLHPKLRLFAGVGILVKLGEFGTFVLISPWMGQLIPQSGQVAMWVGVLLAVQSVGEMIGSILWGKMNDRHPVEHNFSKALALCGLCVLAQAWTTSIPLLIFIRFLQGFFFSALISSILLMVLRHSRSEQGTSIGVMNSILVIGQMVGSLVGSMLAGWMGIPWTIVVMGAVLIGGAAAVAVHSLEISYKVFKKEVG